MNKKLLVICGPTATGKTSLALHLGKVLDGELVSADSRQVYRGMDIGTGKDVPNDFGFRISDLEFGRTKIGYYTNESTRLWGYDLVDPKEEFSVAHYVRIASKIVKDIWSRKKLPILVGGTGLYIKGLVDGIDTAQVPKDEDLRESLEDKSVTELQGILKKIDSKKFERMNESDAENPRRLMRAIEVSKYRKRKLGVSANTMIRIIVPNMSNILFIGLKAPIRFLDERIEQRVDKRLKQGIESEILSLLKNGVTWESQAMQSLGYRQWRRYFEKYTGSGWERVITESTEESKVAERKKAIKLWKTAEKQYARRQMTWFKKDKRIKWFDISKKGYVNDIEKLAGKWYSMSNERCAEKD